MPSTKGRMPRTVPMGEYERRRACQPKGRVFRSAFDHPRHSGLAEPRRTMRGHGWEGQSEDALHGHLILATRLLSSLSSFGADASSKTRPSSDSIIPDESTWKPPTDRRGAPAEGLVENREGSDVEVVDGLVDRDNSKTWPPPGRASGPVIRPVPNSICKVPPVGASHQFSTRHQLRSPAWARSIRPGQPERCHIAKGVKCTPSTLWQSAACQKLESFRGQSDRS